MQQPISISAFTCLKWLKARFSVENIWSKIKIIGWGELIKLTSPFSNLPYLVLFYCASFYFSNLWNTFIEHFHSPLPLEFEPRTLAKESLLDGVLLIIHGLPVSTRSRVPSLFGLIEGPIVLTLTKRVFPRYWGSHVFGIEGLLVKEVAIECTQRYLST